MRILVVDDEEGGRYLASSILTSAGHDVELAVDGVDALERARAHRPDVAVSDILMPRMDGYQLVREWKADPQLSDVPFVFYTASYTGVEDEKFALELGVDGFLAKPVDPSTLLSTVEEAGRSGGAVTPRRPSTSDEAEVLREYSERLVRKLEDKVADLERANAMLGQAMSALGDEVDVKRGLIEDLNSEIGDRKRREDELRAERDFSRRIIETVHVFIVGLDRDLRIKLFNPGAERISGWTAEDVLGTSYFDLLVPEQAREARRSAARSLFEGRETLRHVGEIVTRDGDVRLIDWSATTTLDPQGQVEGVIAFGVDVTDRMTSVAVERAMARIDLAVLLDRPRSEVLDVACERLVAEFGYPLVFVALRDQAEGALEIVAVSGSRAAHFEEITSQLAPDLICPVEAAMERDEVTVVTDADVSFREQGADAFGIQAAAAIPLRAHGATIGAVGLVASYRQAFEGGRAEILRRLADRVATGILVSEGREQVALQSAALESAGNAIVIVNRTGRVTWANRAFGELTGFTPDEVVGANIFASSDDDEEPETLYREPLYREAWETVLSGRTWREEFTNVRRDGVTYLEDVSFAPVRSERREIEHVVVVKQDLSERRELEQLKSSFTAVVSHELRTPLTGIVGYAELLEKLGGEDLDPSAKTAMDKLRWSTLRMQDLVERLLEVTQIETEGLQLDLVHCEVAELIGDAVERTSAPSGVRLDVELPDKPLPVRCDRVGIARALGNILENALRHSPDGGTVMIEVAATGAMVSISVTDEGEGMPPEQIPALFESFVQLDMSSTRRFGGMGVGLFVAYSIARAHGGMLLAASEPGEGSTFTMLLPLEGPDPLSSRTIRAED